MLPSDELKQDGLVLNEALRDQREKIPPGRQRSIPIKGFSFRLPPPRTGAGTDELLARAQREPVLGNPRKSQSFNASYYWQHLDEYFPVQGEADDELIDPSPIESSGRAKGMNNRTYLCSVGDFGMIGHAEFELVLGSTIARFREAKDLAIRRCAASLLVSVACFCPPEQTSLMRVSRDGRAIERKPPPSSRLLPIEPHPDLHEPTSDQISFYAPRLVFEAFSLLRTLPRENQPDASAINAFLQTITPSVTIAKIHAYLLYTGPEHWGYSAVIPVFSSRGIGSRPGVYASYVRASALFDSLASLYRFIEPSYTAPANKRENAFGCDHVPKASEVQAYYTAWQRLFLPPVGASIAEIIHWHNGFVAGMHQFGCLLFGGLRNYPGAPPIHARLADSFIINREKDHAVVTLWSGCLRASLQAYDSVKAVVERELKAVGAKVTWPRNDAYSYLSMDGEVVDISATTTTAALEDYPPLARWARLHPNALRAFAMTVLYEAMVIHPHDIEAFFGRAQKSLAPLRLHRLEDTSLRRIRPVIERELFQYLQ